MADKEKKIVYSVEVEGLDKTKSSFNNLKKSVNGVDDGMGQLKKSESIINSSNKDLKKSTDLLTKEQKKLSKEVDKTANSFNKTKGVGNGFTKTLGSIKVGALAAVGAVIGIAKTLSGTFMKAINSTQDSGDNWAQMMGGMKSATNAFFQSIMNGDWSNLLDNMTAAYEAGKKYAAQLDLLYDLQNANSIQNNKLKLEESKQLAILKNKTNDRVTRENALNEVIRIRKQILTDQLEIDNLAYENQISNIKDRTGLSQKQIEYLISEKSAQDGLNKAAKLREKIRFESGVEIQGTDQRAFSAENYRQAVLKLTTAEQESLKMLEGWNKVLDDNDGDIEATRKTLTDATNGVLQSNLAYEKGNEQLVKYKAQLEKLLETEKKEKEEQKDSTKIVEDKYNTDAYFQAKTKLLREENLINELAYLEQEKLKVLSNKQLTNAERLYIEETYLQKEAQLKAEYRDKEAIIVEQEDENNRLKQEEERLRIEGLRTDFENEIEWLRQSSLSRTQILDEELDRKRDLLKQGIISEKEYLKYKEEIERQKVAAQMATVAATAGAMSTLANNLGELMGKEAKAAKFAKVLAIIQSGANIAAGLAKTGSIGFPQNIPMLIGYAAQTVGIMAQIKSLAVPTPPKLANGGIIGGKPHSQGGTTFSGSDGSKFEAEKGEYLAIINKRDAGRAAMMDSINRKHGVALNGNGNYFAKGGTYSPRQEFSQDPQKAIMDAIMQISTIPITVLEQDITDTQRRVSVINSNGNL